MSGARLSEAGVGCMDVGGRVAGRTGRMVGVGVYGEEGNGVVWRRLGGVMDISGQDYDTRGL